ncbi:S24 family peptidase [Vibrio metoecus]|nr:S24 family peptidase [Vibrio cholerae]
MKLIPIKPHAGIVGFESYADEHKMLDLSLDDFVERPSSSFLAIINGHSMEGVGLFDGDPVLVDRSLDAKTGDIVVAVLNGELTVKIIDIENRMLISANPKFRPVVIDELDDFTIEGVCSFSLRMFRPSHLLVK